MIANATLLENSDVASPERIADLAKDLSHRLEKAFGRIQTINDQSRILSLNAQIEAQRSGVAGAAFGVVAAEMRRLATATTSVAGSVSKEVHSAISELQDISETLATNVRGTRLTDLALCNIDLIDRNLYERSCDCRWWATDSSLVTALSTRTTENCEFASKRLGQILDSYTVYLDLVLANLDGVIVANGRPKQFASIGTRHRESAWFQTAISAKSGAEFGFQSAHVSSLVGDQRSLIYSCGVREGGDIEGTLLGVLGIVFNWDALAQTIVMNCPLAADEKACARVCIVDAQGHILADSHGKQLRASLEISDLKEILSRNKDFVITSVGGKKCIVAHAAAPGFETYSTGWHSVIILEL
jgi:hypothetical protein